MTASRLISIDTETTVTETLVGRNPVGISVGTNQGTFYIPVGHRSSIFGDGNYQGTLPSDLFIGEFTPIFHNAKFDLQILNKCNIEIEEHKLQDTMIMSHYIDERPPHGLKELAAWRLGWNEPTALREAIKKAEKSFGMEGIPADLMAKYAEQDAAMTLNLYTDLLPEFREFENLWESVDRDFMLLLRGMEERGIPVDLDFAFAQSNAASRRMQEIQKLIGFDPAKSSILEKRLFSMPPEGIGLRPSSYTPGGRPQVDEAFLEGNKHPLTALVLEYRRLLKAKSTYFDAYLRMGSLTGTIHTTFKQHGTVTGRLSGEAPNLQNIPREEGKSAAASLIKRCFRPIENSELWEFDFKTIEYRLAAVYSKESSLVNTFREEGDIHQTVADMLNISRQTAKTTNYLILYGGQAGKLAWQLGCSRSTAEGILNKMRGTYPGLFNIMAKAEAQANTEGYIKMWTGRKRHFQDSYESRKAFNAAIQGGSFEIVKRSMLEVDKAGYDIRNQVHDSIWVNIPKEDVKDATVEIPRLMSDWTEQAFGIRFSVDAKRLDHQTN